MLLDSLRSLEEYQLTYRSNEVENNASCVNFKMLYHHRNLFFHHRNRAAKQQYFEIHV
jgi:hypothetical protein